MWRQQPFLQRALLHAAHVSHVHALCSVKAGGADPVTNSKLHDLIKQAKEAGVPKDIVERNLKSAADKNQADFQEVLSRPTVPY